MKKRLFYLFLLPAMICSIFVSGFLNTTGVAHAATAQFQAAHVAPDACASSVVEVIETSGQACCNSIRGRTTPDFIDVSKLIARNFTVSWNWIGCNEWFDAFFLCPHAERAG